MSAMVEHDAAAGSPGRNRDGDVEKAGDCDDDDDGGDGDVGGDGEEAGDCDDDSFDRDEGDKW